MAGLLDYILSGGGQGVGLLGNQMPPQPEPYVNINPPGPLSSLRAMFNQIADPTALQQQYEQAAAQRAGMALLGTLPGGGQTAQQPSSAPSLTLTPPAAPPASSGTPRGIRNNNPLNIEAGTFTQGQPGFAGSDGRFARFDTPQQGIDAAGKLLDTYQSKYGLNTVRGIINRWAPPSENDSGAYVASVAGRLGVNPDQPLTPEQRQPLIMAMGQFENGRPIGGTSQAIGFNGVPERPNAQGVYSSDAVLASPPLSTQRPVQVSQAAAAPQPTAPAMAPPAGSPMINQPGSGLTLVDSPALQGMPDNVRKAIPLMLQSRTMAPQAMALIQKYINPDQWQMWRDSMGNVFTRNSATGESKPLLTPTPQMMNANASGMRSPLEYETGVALGQSAAKNTELTGEQKNARASGMTPLEYDTTKAQTTQAAQKRGEAEGVAQSALTNAVTQSELALQNINQIRNHPGRNSIFATGALGMMPGIPGTEQKGFVTLVDQLKNRTFLQAYESLRGSGAITNIEGTKGENAIARLDRAQNASDFNAALGDLEDVIKIGVRNAKSKAAGISVPRAASSASDPLGIR